MTIRKTTKWLFILVLLIAAIGGWFAFKLWNESNERIRIAILAKCEELVPDWDVTLGRARFDWNRRVHLYDFTLRAKGQSQNIVSIPEVVVSIDRELFAEQQQVDVQKVRILGPTIDLIRDAQGQWNWQQLKPPPQSNQSLPEIEVVQATIRVRLDQSDGAAAAVLGMQNADLKLIPSGKRQFLIQGLTQVSQAGKLTIEGSWHLDRKTGWFNGKMNDVDSHGELSGLIIGSSPELRLKLARFQAAVDGYAQDLRQTSPARQRDPFLFASTRTEQTSPASNRTSIEPGDGVPNLGASANLDVEFNVAVKQPKTEPDFKLKVKVKQGQIENDALPFTLRDLTGTIDWDNDRLILSNLTAKNGKTRISMAGRFDRQGPVSPGEFEFAISNLLLDERLRRRLPPSFRKSYDSVSPSGTADIQGKLLFDGVRIWRPQGVVATLKNCSGRHIKFPYPVEKVTGLIRQRGEIFDVELAGQAGGQPASLSGYIRNPGPAAECYFAIHADRIPINDTFVAACQPPVQKTLNSLDLEGDITADMTMHRPTGIGQKFTVHIAARVSQATMEFVHFPYRLEKLQGDVTFSSADQSWLFQNLSAVHGNAKLAANASFVKREAPGLFQMTLTADNADLDRQLKQALNVKLQKTWDQLSPSGQIKHLVSQIRWVPGQPADISLTEATVTNGELTLSAFPYPLEEVELSFSYANSAVTLTSLAGKHDNTAVRINGNIAWNEQGDWRVRLDELIVDDLVPDRLFRRALPSDLRTVIEEIDPAGPISLDGMVEFRGNDQPNSIVTAAWDLNTIHTGGQLKAGIDLKKPYGRLTARGTWDGERVKMTGQIDLDTLEVRGYQFTNVQGPYSINGNEVVVGSYDILHPDRNQLQPPRVPPDQRVTARAIGGIFTLDAEVELLEEPTYRVKITMSEGRLEQYARRYMSGAKNLAGVMDGWVDLSGRGSSSDTMTGRGQMRINPAALYELPVILQIAKVLGPTDKTAFRYALLDFNIARSQFRFNTIDLVGDSLSLRGRGTTGFDGRLDLDFYSMLPRNRVRIPIISAVVGEATKGWVGVKVRGTTSVPKPSVVPAPQVDEALKGFLGAFGKVQPNSIPRLLFPPLIQPRRTGQQYRTPPPRTPLRQ